MSSTSPTPPLTTWELVKMTLPIIGFGILLPTVDNLTDLRMIIRLYRGIPGCKYVDPWAPEMNGTWEDLYTCQQDPDTYCQLNNKSSHCDDFYRWGYLDDFPICSQDIDTCRSDPATFCEDNPDRVTCGGIYKHRIFASMFLGNFLMFTRNNFMKSFLFQCHVC